MGPHYDAENDLSTVVEDQYTSSSDEIEEEKKGTTKMKKIMKNKFLFMILRKGKKSPKPDPQNNKTMHEEFKEEVEFPTKKKFGKLQHDVSVTNDTSMTQMNQKTTHGGLGPEEVEVEIDSN